MTHLLKTALFSLSAGLVILAWTSLGSRSSGSDTPGAEAQVPGLARGALKAFAGPTGADPALLLSEGGDGASDEQLRAQLEGLGLGDGEALARLGEYRSLIGDEGFEALEQLLGPEQGGDELLESLEVDPQTVPSDQSDARRLQELHLERTRRAFDELLQVEGLGSKLAPR